MFVSSFNTYIDTNSSKKTAITRLQKSKEQTASFVSHLSNDEVVESKNSTNLPLNYISNYKVFNNKQKLQNQIRPQNKDKIEYEKSRKIKNAISAYADNSKMFSLMIEPETTQSKALHVDNNTKHIAINIYISNNNYYRITA